MKNSAFASSVLLTIGIGLFASSLAAQNTSENGCPKLRAMGPFNTRSLPLSLPRPAG